MAAPNVADFTTITGKVAGQAVGVSATAIVSNASSSGTLVRVTGLTIANVDGTNDADITVDVYKNATTAYRLAYTITVPADSTLVVISRDIAVYLEENDSLRLTASAASDLEAVCSYEIIS